MIIDSNQHPEKNIYFTGGRLLKQLCAKRSKETDINILFNEYNKKNSTSISFDYFLLTLNWLFILNTIKTNEKGNILLCI